MDRGRLWTEDRGEMVSEKASELHRRVLGGQGDGKAVSPWVVLQSGPTVGV